MRYMTKAYIWRWVVLVIALVAFGVLLLIQKLVFEVTLEADRSSLIIGMIFTGVGYGLAWVISSAYKSNRDTMLHELGDIELEMYEGLIKQVRADRARGK